MTYYSQNGEDQFLEHILPDKGWFVDVGAWNGKYLSNTFFFVERGWNGLEIERDKGRVLEMKRFLPDRIYRLAKMVLPEEIDDLIQMFPDIPIDFDLLSVDIDTYDYWVWKNMTVYQPKFVIIETTGGPGYRIQPPVVGYRGSRGTTPEAMNELAIQKGYEMIWDKANYIYKKK